MADSFIVETGSGSTTGNAYCTVDQADIYHDNKLFSTTWTGSSDDNKESAIVWATRLLDELVAWNGYKYTETQALQWPRNGCYDRGEYAIDTDEIPPFLRDATAEFAKWLIASDRTAENDTRGYKFLQVGTLKMSINKRDRIGILPDVVWSMIKFSGTKASGQTKYLKRA